MSIKSRLQKLESQQPQPEAAPRISDEERMRRMIELSRIIATEAKAQGITAQDDPRLALPLVVAEVTA